jgi:hypothetical protein
MTEAEAIAALEAIASITVTTSYEHHDTIAAGDVISMDPPAGTLVVPDQVVHLVVSLGPSIGWFTVEANQDESEKKRYRPFLAVDFDFPSGHVRLWTGTGTLPLFGNQYLGMGHLARVSMTVDRVNLTVERKTYQLSGAKLDPSVVSEDDLDNSFGRSVTEYLGFLNNTTHQLLADPEINFEGEIAGTGRKDGREPMIEVTSDSRLIILDRPDGWRYTQEHQRDFYPQAPLDLGFDKMVWLETKERIWGGRRVFVGTGGTGGGRGDAPLSHTGK